MANDEPPYLTVGTDVSAKYKGAFCEAKIKKVNRVVKCKVTFKNSLGSFMVTDDLIKGSLRMGADIEAKHPEKNQFLEAVINKLQDYSQYTVVFDDGDETTLRRTSLCLKSGRHFAESPTLDQFPLTNPEHFGTPVIGAGKYKRKRRSTMNSSLDYESSDDDPFPRKLKAIRGKERDPDLGKVVAVDYGDRRKKDSWYPGLIVPHPAQSNIKISKEEHLIRSFKDGKYYQVPKRDTREFVKETLPKIENNALKLAVDKAVLYLEKDELPAHWDKALFMGLELPSADEGSQESDSDSSDDEPSEDKDRFVAQLYKFMDERGTPINKAPTVCNRDLNLYKLFKIMHKSGGFNKVTNQNKWKSVYLKMGLPPSNINGPNQIKGAYKRYLQSFEDFYRKLGCTMVNNSRSTRGRHRSDRNFIITRTKDRETASPKGRNTKDIKERNTPDKKINDKPQLNDKKDNKAEEVSKTEDKQKSPEKKKIDNKARVEEKDDKQKKEERPRLVRSQSLNNKDKKSTSPKEDDKKETKPEKARTREDARKEKNESPEKKGTRSSVKIEMEKKEKEESIKDKKEQSPKAKEKKDEKSPKEIKDDKAKDKKDDKSLKERKIVKDKKTDEKTVKEKCEGSPKEKKDEKVVLREKRDSSKEPKEEKNIKGRKDDSKSQDEKSPVKKKLDRLAKDKKDEKIFRPRRENKSPLPENKKIDESESKNVKEEKQKNDEVKKEEVVPKERLGPKLRERSEGTPFTEEVCDSTITDISDDKDIAASQDEFEKKGPGSKLKEDTDEPPNRGKKKNLKTTEKDDKECEELLSDSDDETFANDNEKDFKDLKSCEIELGDLVKVKYGRGRLKKVYDAKVLKIQSDGSEKRYFVHYNGWNNRYDEWVRRNLIVALVNSSKQKIENSVKNVFPMKRIDRGRPPGPIKPTRKNSTSSTNSSVSCSRATRSDKKNLQSPLSSGLEPKKRTRKKCSIVLGLTDSFQESDSDVEETIDLDDDDVGDADVEDNANTQNDSCFKEELFSDDEEKEKLEDVKRDDITELEKAITVEESVEDIKDTFFTPIKKEICTEETPIKEENIEVPGISDNVVNDNSKKEDNTVNMKLEKEEKTEKNEPQKCTPSKVPENEVELVKTEIVLISDKVPSPEIPVITNVNKNIIEPSKILPNLTASPEPKSDKSLFSPLLPKISPLSNSEPCKGEFSKNPFTPSPQSLSMSESRSMLSFAGLQGLIQKSAFDRSLSFGRNVKDTPPKIDSSKVLNTSPPKIDLKPDSVPKSFSSSLFRPEKVMPIFGSTNCLLSPPKLIEPAKNEEKPSNTPSVFNCIIKSIDKQQNKEVKPLESFKTPVKDDKKELLNLWADDWKTFNTDSTVKKPESSIFKQCIMNPKFVPVKSEPCEIKIEKVKDNFDLLVEGSTLSEPKKPVESKDIFSLSFANIAPKEKFTSSQIYAKPLSLSSDKLCCIKPKPSETFDLSKTIPNILERLKKDVVADLKVTDSPPPQREELSFNFLRGSQDAGKSLSRSESSNSLRICEDLSDTNDSNTNSKDLSEKFDNTSVVSSASVSDNAVPCPSESLVKFPEPPKIEISVPVSIQNNSDSMEKKEEAKNNPKASVITLASIKPLVPVINPEIKDDKDSSTTESESISKDDDKKVEPVNSKPEKEEEEEKKEESKVEDTSEVKDVDTKSECPSAPIVKETISENNVESNNEQTTHEKSEKDSLFDDLLKIKTASTNLSQSSVIMWNPEMKVTPAIEEKSEPSEGNDTPIKEELSVAETEESLMKKNALQQEEPIEVPLVENSIVLEKLEEEDLDSNVVTEIKSEPEDNEIPEDEGGFTLLSKKEVKKKKLSKKLKKFGNSEGFEKDERDSKSKEGKSKSKKRSKMDDDSERSSDLKSKSKKIKKNKNKKRLAKLEELQEHLKKGDGDDDHKDFDKIRKKEKRKSEKKFFKSSLRGEYSDSKLELKKKKGKKNRDKLSGEKKDFLEKKAKKKKKPHFDDNQDTDSEKDILHKSSEKKKKKDRKKFKTKDSSSSDDAGDKFFKEQNKSLHSLPSSSNALLRQDSNKSDDPDMSFLLCQEKVPASPVGINNIVDDTSGSSSTDGNRINAEIDILPLPNVYPCIENIESSDAMNKHGIDTSAVLDNTPPTTPSSTESLLSSSPSHERDSFSMNYPESTQSGRDSGEGESDIYRVNSNRTIVRGSEEYHAATTLAFAVCKSVSEKPKEDTSHNFLKRQKSEIEEHSPSKRKKKSKRVRRSSESAKSPRHKPSLSRLSSKVESCCDDSSGASPAASSSPPYSNTSNMSFSRSPHRSSCPSESFSRYNYVPLHEKDPEKRIALLQEKMAALRKEYMELRAKVIAIDHKRRRARKKIREAGAANANPSVQTEDGQSCS